MQTHNQLKWGPLTFLTTLAVITIMITLWQYKEIVGTVLLVLLIAGVAVALRSQINEQWLRHQRFHHDRETPLPSHAQSPYLQEIHTYQGPAVYDDEQQLHIYDERR